MSVGAKMENEMSVQSRVTAFAKSIKAIAPDAKFTTAGATLTCTSSSFSTLGTKLQNSLMKSSRKFGVTLSCEGDKITANVLTPSQMQVMQAAAAFAQLGETQTIDKLKELLEKLDPKVKLDRDGGKVIAKSERFASRRLDDAFETMGMKCGLRFLGRTEEGWVVWHGAK